MSDLIFDDQLTCFSPPLDSSPVTTATQLDWSVVTTLRKEVIEQLSSAATTWEQENHTSLLELDRRMQAKSIISNVVRRHAQHLAESGQMLWDVTAEQHYADAIESAIYGYGRLQPLFDIPEAENIEIHGWDTVSIQFGDGSRISHPPVADSDAELVEAVRFLGETASPPRPFDDAHPTMTLALGTQFRLHAIGFGLSHRPSIVIRQHRLKEVTLGELSTTGMFPSELAQLLRTIVLARKSIVISGDQGAGKTTLLRALVDAIPETERFGTLETDYELLTHLHPKRKNILALQSRLSLGETNNGSAVGGYSIADLIPEALRQNLTRLIVGEVRGEEANAMFEAMQAGTGTMSTTHSHSALSTIDRLASRVARDGALTMEQAMLQIAHHIHFIIHVELLDETWRGGKRSRHISEVLQLTGSAEAGRPCAHVVYRKGKQGMPDLFDPNGDLLAELLPFQRRP